MYEIANWEMWQTYRKDRGTPPWIKVHRNLMTNTEWAMLTDSEKGQLVSMWIVAADRNGRLPNDARTIQKIAMLDDLPNMQRFMDLGFVASPWRQDDVNVTSSWRQRDAPETETETETETDPDILSGCQGDVTLASTWRQDGVKMASDIGQYRLDAPRLDSCADAHTIDSQGEGGPPPEPKRGKKDRLSRIQRQRFDAFWALWPRERKIGKGEAEKEWGKLCPDEPTAAGIMSGLEAQLASGGSMRQRLDAGEEKFIVHPCRWLKQRRWEDDPKAGTGAPKGYQHEKGEPF